MKCFIHISKVLNLIFRLCFFKFCKTNEECEHLISLAKPSMVKSKVVDVKTGKSIDSRFCTLVLFPFNLNLEIFEKSKFAILHCAEHEPVQELFLKEDMMKSWKRLRIGFQISPSFL